MRHLFKKIAQLVALTAMITLTFIACQKDIDGTVSPPTTPPGTDPIDLTATVTSKSISGFVTDETNAPVSGASVKIGTATVTTDNFGYFQTSNVTVVKNAAVVTVTKAGYFNGIKTYIAEAGKSAFFRIKLIPKTEAGSFSATTGGTITAAGGLKIAFPANSIVVAFGAAYTGTVHVAAKWIDPTASDLNKIMPGDLRGLDSANVAKILTTYGMAAVEMTGDAGQLLQIAAGKKATMTVPLPAAIAGSAPASIPLWYFDETKGLWKEEGMATKTGSTYTGEVGHFSFWNYDVPANYVQLNLTVKTPTGSAVAFARVKISLVSNPQNASYGYTDSSGYVNGAVPNNSQLKIEIFTDNSCTNALHTETFTTTDANLSLAVTVTPPVTNLVTVSGIVTDCSNAPVTNGFVIVIINNINYRYNLTNSGSFSFTHVLCGAADNAKFIGIDLNNPQQIVTVNYPIVPGVNQVSGLKVCGIVNTEEFISYTLAGGTPHTFSNSNIKDSLYHKADSIGTAIVGATRKDSLNTVFSFAQVRFNTAGIGLSSNQNLIKLYGDGIFVPSSIPNPINVNITEYGAVGQYVSGNFTGQIIGYYASPTTMNVVCSFRVKRVF